MVLLLVSNRVVYFKKPASSTVVDGCRSVAIISMSTSSNFLYLLESQGYFFEKDTDCWRVIWVLIFVFFEFVCLSAIHFSCSLWWHDCMYLRRLLVLPQCFTLALHPVIKQDAYSPSLICKVIPYITSWSLRSHTCIQVIITELNWTDDRFCQLELLIILLV